MNDPLIEDPDLENLLHAILLTGREVVVDDPNPFTFVMAVQKDGEIVVCGEARLSATWMEESSAIEQAARARMKRGQLRALGVCIHIAHGEKFIRGEVPVLVVNLERADGQKAQAREHYQRLSDGTIQPAPLRVSAPEHLS